MLFQFRPLAEYGLLPDRVPFQLLVILAPSLYDQLTFQPLIAELPLLVIRIAPVKPSFHWLVTTYVHLAPFEATLLEELLLILEELLTIEEELLLIEEELLTTEEELDLTLELEEATQ